MDQSELARAAAAALAPEVAAELEREIKGEPAPGGGTRAFGISEAMAAAGFLFSAAGVVMEVINARKQSAELVADLADGLDVDPRLAAHLNPEKRLGLVARLLNSALPSTFDTTTAASRRASVADKQRWITEYVESRRRSAGLSPSGGMATRDFHGGATILMPFADQLWWILYQPVGWIPGSEDGPGLPRVDVPRGFVTDLASVPSYLWSVLQQTGRHGNAAIYHDWLYWDQTVPRSTADRVFDRAMNDMGVDPATRRLMWAGVRVFGGSYWDDNTTARARGEKRVLARFPEAPTITWDDWRQRPDVFAADDGKPES